MTGVRDLSARFHGVRYSLGRKESCASPWGRGVLAIAGGRIKDSPYGGSAGER